MQLDIVLANPDIVNGSIWSHGKHVGIFECMLYLGNSREVIKLELNIVTPVQLDQAIHF